MNSKRMYFVLIGIIALMIVGLVGGAYGVDALLQKQSKNLSDQRLQTETLDAQQTALTKAKRDVKQYKSLAEIAKSIVPQDKGQAQTVREIVKIANSSGIKLSGITFPSSTLGETGGSLSLSQLEPVEGIPGVYSLEIVVQSDTEQPVPYARFIKFLDRLEHNRRTALVSSINITPDSKNSANISFTLTLDEYIKP